MRVYLRSRALPLLLSFALLATLPSVAIWSSALIQSLGVGHPLDLLPTPAAAPTRLDRLAWLVLFWAVTLGGPLAINQARTLAAGLS
ncbi:MAG: hypothetical protein ACR2IK_16625 [Chloroflexota bacterium]